MAKIKTATAKNLNANILWSKLVKINPKAASPYFNRFKKIFNGK